MSDGRTVVKLMSDAGKRIAFDDPSPFVIGRTVSQDELSQGHVGNVTYIKWMDDMAAAHSAAVGYDVARYEQMGTVFVVRRHEVEYLGQTFLGDRMILATWPCKMERFTAVRKHQIVRASDGATVLRARSVWVYLNRETGRPSRMPAELIEAFSPRQDEK